LVIHGLPFTLSVVTWRRAIWTVWAVLFGLLALWIFVMHSSDPGLRGWLDRSFTVIYGVGCFACAKAARAARPRVG